MAITVRRALLTGCVCILASCSSSPSKSSSSESSVPLTSASFTTVIATTTTTTTAPRDTGPTTTSGPLLTVEDARIVADCVKFIPIGAIIADDEATNLWAIAGQDLTKLTGLCTALLTSAPATLGSLSLKLKAFEIAQAAATTTSSPDGTTTSIPTATTLG